MVIALIKFNMVIIPQHIQISNHYTVSLKLIQQSYMSIIIYLKKGKIIKPINVFI